MGSSEPQRRLAQQLALARACGTGDSNRLRDPPRGIPPHGCEKIELGGPAEKFFRRARPGVAHPCFGHRGGVVGQGCENLPYST